MEPTERHQLALLEQIRYVNREAPISAAVEEAYRVTPRHAFVGRYRMPRSRDWREVPSGDPGEHLKTIYSDIPLVLSGDDDRDVDSTISQPSLVLRMLDMLRLAPGQRVFELGTGSGWSAALMGRIVGSSGRVHTLETWRST